VWARSVYNYSRDYDPAVGRYVESDPMGLRGGSYSTYAYGLGNPLSNIDPLGLWSIGDPINQGVANAVTGFGDGVYKIVTLGFGDLNKVREAAGISGGIDTCSSAYRGGRYAGYAWGVGLGWAAGLNGGANSVFWSGYQQGARGIAESLGGTTLESTPIGSALDFASNTLGIPGLTPVWNAASATFALNASGTANAVILAEGTTWTSIELPILSGRGIPIVFH
jgi:hypothetical protein